LQTVPDGYTDHVSNTQRYKMLGNGWTVDVIAHIYSEMELPIQAFARQLDLFGEVA
jgi:site-specific DNA-cytosine methylase